MRSTNELIILMKEKAYDIKKKMTADVFLEVAEVLEKFDRLQKDGRDHTTCMNEWQCGWTADPKDCPSYKEDITSNVRNPEHYQGADGRDCWTAMIDEFGVDDVITFDTLNAFKYNFRKGKKAGNPTKQDEAKFDEYVIHANRLILRSDVESRERGFRRLKKLLRIAGKVEAF